MSKSNMFRRRIQINNFEFTSFYILEVLFVCFLVGLFSPLLNWHSYASAIIAFFIFIVISNTRFRYIIVWLFSLIWGIAGFLFLSKFISLMDGGLAISYVVGIIGFLLAGAFTLVCRIKPLGTR